MLNEETGMHQGKKGINEHWNKKQNKKVTGSKENSRRKGKEKAAEGKNILRKS